ncbi:Ref family recombination enhancement nuclease [Acinetobacter junii]|uniref:Ref family recombination enhancement nuclease n=1 Tax=Acinetobacter junii TaxID=40215 RepID=UPI0032B41A11
MRDRKRLAEIRKLPCVLCGSSPVDAAHSNQSSHGKGMGLKACDYKTIPLCRNHHQEFDQFQKMNRSESVEWFAKMLEKTELMMGIEDREVF